MPAVVPFIPLITGGIAAATGIAGAKIQSGSNKQAIDAQQQANQQAQNVLLQERGQQIDAYNKWLQGAQAPQSIADLMGYKGSQAPSAPFLSTAPIVPTQTIGNMMGPAGGGSYSQAGPTGPAMSTGGMVTLRAPTGQTKAFAPNDPQLQVALAHGAQRVA